MCGPNSASGFGFVMALQEPAPDTQCQPCCSGVWPAALEGRNNCLGNCPCNLVTNKQRKGQEAVLSRFQLQEVVCRRHERQLQRRARQPAVVRPPIPASMWFSRVTNASGSSAWPGTSRDLRSSLNMQLTAHLSCPDQNSGSTSVLFSICAIAQALRSCTTNTCN